MNSRTLAEPVKRPAAALWYSAVAQMITKITMPMADNIRLIRKRRLRSIWRMAWWRVSSSSPAGASGP
jgi:hypothetical protein